MTSFRDSLHFEAQDERNPFRLRGFVRCWEEVQLLVAKKFDVRHDSRGRMYVRCYNYNYVGFVPGRHLLLKYHNLHADPDEYVHRVYDPATGEEMLYETLHRYQFPTFPEVLDELERIARTL